MRPSCLHPGCRNVAAYGRRGLCQRHYFDPAVRALYPARPRGPAPKPWHQRCLVPGCSNVAPQHKSGLRGLCVRHHRDPAVRAQYRDRRHNAAKRPPNCAHCRRGGLKIGARDLCKTCFRKPAIRHQYPITNHPAALGRKRQVEADRFKPCPWPPFHPKRVEAMQRRIELGQPLHHPGDAGNEAWGCVEGKAVEWASDLRIREVVA